MVSVIIPTYNEVATIRPLLARLQAVGGRLGEALEVLVVDDGSTDGTQQDAGRFFAASGGGRLLVRRGTRDLGAAVVEGGRQAHGDVAVVMDADLSHPPEVLPELVRVVRQGRAVAVASRQAPGARVIGWPPHRRVLSWLANCLARPLVSVRDASSGFFACRTELLRALEEGTLGFKVLMEILTALPAGAVQEVPYTFSDRAGGRSKLSWRVMRRYGAQLIRLYARRLRGWRSGRILRDQWSQGS